MIHLPIIETGVLRFGIFKFENHCQYFCMSFSKLYFWIGIVGWFLAAQIDAANLNATEEASLKDARQGGVVMLDELWSNQTKLPLVPTKISPAGGPQFLFSDRPEYFLGGNGIALQEKVKPGTVRLYLYHVP